MPPRHLYVHVPFCARRCAYCDFSIAVRRTTPVDEYLGALRTELQMVAHEMGHPSESDWPLDTLYLGGGTPSRLGSAIPRLFDTVREVATILPGAEVTIEANPEDVSPENAASWRSAGANRLSLGSQSFDPAVLSWMHRVHSADQIPLAVKIARDAGFDNISLDLIFAVPRALNRDWQRDLESAVALDPAHISLYGLTVEPRTPLSRWRDRGEVREAGDEAYETEFLLAHHTLKAAGYDHYEVSNFSKPDRHSRHNSAYWSGSAYTGIGPSAHSFDGTRRWWNVAPYAEWIDRLTHNSTPVADVEVLDEENISNEKVYLGLRSSLGVRVAGDELAELQPWLDRGWASISAVDDDASAGRVAGRGTPSQERLSRRRSSSEGVPSPATRAGQTGVNDAEKLTLTPTGWLLLDELAANLTWIRSRSYV
ncbi:MAG: radical SAM family heme chaperone HemW [Gemmatimonadaceae bacterium]